MEYELVVVSLHTHRMEVASFDSEEQMTKILALRGNKLLGRREQSKEGFRLAPILIGQPIYSGLLGPMVGNDGSVRYETPEANERLSI